MKQRKDNDAAELAYDGATALLRAGQEGSGADLAQLLLDVWTRQQLPVTDATGGASTVRAIG